jgi:hypothetical protein
MSGLLDEEEILFILLSHYARSFGAHVYLEIQRPGEIQILDSTMEESGVPRPNAHIVEEEEAASSDALDAQTVAEECTGHPPLRVTVTFNFAEIDVIPGPDHHSDGVFADPLPTYSDAVQQTWE